MKIPEIKTLIAPINSFQVTTTKQCKSNKDRANHTIMFVPGRSDPVTVAPRFWTSFSSLFNIGMNIFTYFEYDEIFNRLATASGNSVRLAFETFDMGGQVQLGRVLSCTAPTKPFLKALEVQNLIEAYDGDLGIYNEGLVQASFKAPFPVEFTVANSSFQSRFQLVLPIDGYGLPTAYLELYRTNSSSVLSGCTKAFKTQFQLGKDDTSLIRVLERAMTTFNNEEGYHSFKQRLEASAKSWASFHEAGELHNLIERVLTADSFPLDTRQEILKAYNKAVGNPLEHYGISSPNELSNRKAKTIPVEATIFELFNFVTEINTHYIKTMNGRATLNQWVGETLAEEYDLEGTADNVKDFKDFFLDGTKTIIEETKAAERVLFLGDVDEIPEVPKELTELSIDVVSDKVEELVLSTWETDGGKHGSDV